MDFKDRKVAGIQLAKALQKYHKAPKTICIGLPRGGVVVAAEISRILEIGLDIIVPRKLGAPGNREFGIGAIVGDMVWIDPEAASETRASPDYIAKIVELEKKEAKRRLSLFRGEKKPRNFLGWTVILIDDGIATGSTMRISIAWLRSRKSEKIVIAVPVAPLDVLEELVKQADETVCLYAAPNFHSVGQFYEKFPQVTDQEVIALLSSIRDC